MANINDLYDILNKLDSQNFGPKDSVTLSSINHPIGGLLHAANWIKNNMDTGMSPYSSSDQQTSAALNIAGLLGNAKPALDEALPSLLGKFQAKLNPENSVAHELSRAEGAWLPSQGVDKPTTNKLVQLHEAIGNHDVPGTEIYGPDGEVWFKSNDSRSHVLRQMIGSTEIGNMLKDKWNLSDKDLVSNTVAAGIHDGGKAGTPLDVLQRAKGFPTKPELLPSKEEVNGMPDSEFKTYMTAFYARNPGEIEFTRGHFTNEDFKSMQRHNETTALAAQKFGLPEDLTRAAMGHHTEFDRTGGYPSDLYGPNEEIPWQGRIQAGADAYDAITENRYNRGPSDYLKSIKEGFTQTRRGSTPDGKPNFISSKGTQFDPDVHDAVLQNSYNYFHNISNKRGYKLAGLLFDAAKKANVERQKAAITPTLNGLLGRLSLAYPNQDDQ